ncbi:hypothetical protein BT96DRAFT_855748 [Gymnopus androsaceus JB14]|uniref:ZZ-type domain-containing protein n=1 Tax=Gymnopus androsaceus JB14 TaxID=1447944 RepID=A0A6A4HVD7_9AGAR|nr:hypothetical protein BT96DRAFT_855748 [Gymnopus androsaceus JB14]
MDGVEAIVKAQPFPFVQVAVLLVRGIVKLETQRRENSRKARALIFQMADMLGALLQLHNVQDPELKDERGQSIQGRIQVLMKDIEADIRECGALIDAYHKHSLTSKFFFSDSYMSQFKDCGETLVNRKGDIVFALTIHTTVTVDKVRGYVKANNELLQQLITVVEHKTKQQEDLEKMISENGGRQKVLDSDELLLKMSKEIQANLVMEEPNQSTLQTKSTPRNSAALLNSRETYELRLSLDIILQENAVHYSRKLDAQVKAITDEIKLSIQLSTMQILRHFNAGPHERVHNPDIRELWRQMNWRYSVRCRDFVKALQEFYFDRFSTYIHHDESNFTTSTDDPDGSFDGQLIAVERIEDDEWCLQYLAAKYERQILEVFDSDNSGFIRISEVNDFTKTLPEGWTMLQALSYCAQGWSIETAIYSRKILALLHEMRHGCEAVFVDNLRMMQWFMQSSWYRTISWLLLGAGEKHTVIRVFNPLDELIAKNMAGTQERIRESLQQFIYTIDEQTSIGLITGPGRFEQTLLPLVYLFLRHQHAFIKYARDHVYPNTPTETKTLYDLEFLDGYISLNTIEDAITARIETLKASFLHHGQDPESRISTFAGGLYTYCSKTEMPQGVEFESIDWRLPPDISQPDPDDPFIPTRAEWPLVADVETLNPNPAPSSIPDSIVDVLDTFYCLTIAEVRTLERDWFWGHKHGSDFISEAEKEELAVLREQIPPEVQDNCLTRAKSAIRQSKEHLGTYCDSCDVYPIPGVRHNCMFCTAFDLCSSCDATLPPAFNTPGGDAHKPWHPTLLMFRPTAQFEHILFRPFKEIYDSESESFFKITPDTTVPNEHCFACTHCGRSLTGTRYLYLLKPWESKSKYMCSDCYTALHVKYDINSLPKEYHHILRFTLPPPDDKHDGEPTEADDGKAALAEASAVKRLEAMQDRLSALEDKFSDIERKLDRLIDMLS